MSEIYIKPAHGPRRNVTPELISRCVLRYTVKGMSLNDIAIRENTSAPTIRRILASCGVAIRGRGAVTDSFRYCPQRCWPHNLQGDSSWQSSKSAS